MNEKDPDNDDNVIYLDGCIPEGGSSFQSYENWIEEMIEAWGQSGRCPLCGISNEQRKELRRKNPTKTRRIFNSIKMHIGECFDECRRIFSYKEKSGQKEAQCKKEESNCIGGAIGGGNSTRRP